MGTLKDLAHKGKDMGVSRALMALGERYFDRFGKILDLKLDSKNNEIHLEILLRGESTPVEVYIKRYTITEERGMHFIAAEKIYVSREWMNVLAREYVQGRRFKISGTYSKILEKLAFS
ncbi:MAG TPA: hypothetical protein ENN05_12370 [Deltaproteobacteria bacterium]|nr:hypothetical protein [Deltaproteobacteria bacterium]